MQQTSDQRTETKAMLIPIQIEGCPFSKQKTKTHKPRRLPFEFPGADADGNLFIYQARESSLGPGGFLTA